MESVLVRAGAVPEGSYNINSRKGRLEKMMATVRVNLQGAEIQTLGSESASGGMARAGAVGGLLLGGAGVAIGVLTAKKGTVLFEAKLADGRVMVGQCTPSAFQELMVARYSTAPVSVAPPPSPPVPLWRQPAVWFLGLMLTTCLWARCLRSDPTPSASAAPAVPFEEAQAQVRKARLAQIAAAERAERDRAKLITVAPYDGTPKSAQRGMKLVLASIDQGMSCDWAHALGRELFKKGHVAAIGRLNVFLKAENCGQLIVPTSPVPAKPARSKRTSAEAERDDFTDSLMRNSKPTPPTAEPGEEPAEAPERPTTRPKPRTAAEVLDPFG